MTAFWYLLALFWGAIWALTLQSTEFGKWLVVKRTWITVVIGVAGDGLILLALLDWSAWLHLLVVFVLSSVFIIGRSLKNEYHELKGEVNVVKAKIAQQNRVGLNRHR